MLPWFSEQELPVFTIVFTCVKLSLCLLFIFESPEHQMLNVMPHSIEADHQEGYPGSILVSNIVSERYW